MLYVGGIGRSGSTLIERLIGQLPGACPVGELVYLYERGIDWGERCGCGQPFHECLFWRQVGKAGFGGWDEVDARRIGALRFRVDRNRYIPALAGRVLRPARRQALDEYTSYYARLYGAIRDVSGCHLVVDSSKHPSLAHCLRWRDEESYMWRYSPAMAAGQWDAQNADFHLLARLGCPTMRLRYEDFIAAPEAALRRVADFAGLPSQAGFPFLGTDGASSWVELDSAHSVSGNPMRFATGKIPIRRDERWRTCLPKVQRRAVTALTFPLLASYGYLGAKA